MMIATKTEQQGTKGKSLLALGFLAALMAVGLLLTAEPVHAATTTTSTFTVNSIGDNGDQTPGDGECFTGSVLVIGDECTLRAAIEEANANKGKDTIDFDIPTTGDPHHRGRDHLPSLAIAEHNRPGDYRRLLPARKQPKHGHDRHQRRAQDRARRIPR